ncbi:MAG TPA: hypothetical protein VNT79_07580 [Phycisphaerae bacterium]|nr:hypothetical protein [Phycisphaerae bacterium]
MKAPAQSITPYPKLDGLRVFLAVGIAFVGNCVNGQSQRPTTAPVVANERSDGMAALGGREGQSRAIAEALEVFGIRDSDSVSAEARVVTLSEDKTPFLHDQITNRPIWQVTIADYRLKLRSAPEGHEDSISRTFDVLIDPTGNRLLKITSRWPEGYKESAPEPRAAFAEDRFRDSGREVYHGFPDPPPAVNFLQALNIIYTTAADPYDAKQIVAHYVARSTLGRKPQDVWAINLRGITPFESSYPGVLECARDHKRHIVDAKSGKWLFASTSPQPETPE